MVLLCFNSGDNVIVGSKDGKLCWFDMDLSSKPYKILKYVNAFIFSSYHVCVLTWQF